MASPSLATSLVGVGFDVVDDVGDRVGSGVGFDVGSGIGDRVGSSVVDGISFGVGDDIGFRVGKSVSDVLELLERVLDLDSWLLLECFLYLFTRNRLWFNSEDDMDMLSS